MESMLQVKLVPPEKLHPKLWVGANRKFKLLKFQEMQRKLHNKVRTSAEQKKQVTGLVKKDKRRRAKLKATGIDFNFHDIRDSMPVRAKKIEPESGPDSAPESAPVRSKKIKRDSAPESAPVRSKKIKLDSPPEPAPVRSKKTKLDSAPVRSKKVKLDSAPVRAKKIKLDSAPGRSKKTKLNSVPGRSKKIKLAKD